MDTTGAGVGILGLILGIILFVIGLVWLIFPFIVNSWLKKIHDQMSEATMEARNLTQEAIKTNQLLAQSLAISKKPIIQAAPVPIPEPASQPQVVHISKDGKDIGEYTLINVKQMLKSRQLTVQDMYFDIATQEWTALDLHPSLY